MTPDDGLDRRGRIPLIAAIIGFVTTPLSIAGGLLLDLFPVNAVHNLLHLIFGVGDWRPGAHRPPRGATAGAQALSILRWR